MNEKTATYVLAFLLVITNLFWFGVTRNLEHLYTSLDAELTACYSEVQQ
jgi:hypothetical protein